MTKEHYEFIKSHVPCYLYSIPEIIEHCTSLRDAMPGFELLYSVKTNPYPEILKTVAAEGFGSDAASAREVELSQENGILPGNIYYSAPGKTKSDIDRCIDKSIIIADSLSEIMAIDEIAKKKNLKIKIGIRINPDFSMESDSIVSSKFGIDIEKMDEIKSLLERCFNLQIGGIHVHIKSQVLDPEKLGYYYDRCFEMAKILKEESGIDIEFINFGSGIGTVYDTSREKPLDLVRLSQFAEGIAKKNSATLKAKLLIESGRFIVCSAGKYYTEIVDIKESRGIKYLMVTNGMNGFMRPAIANLLKKNSFGNDIPGQEPLYTCSNAFGYRILTGEREEETVNVVGNLCTSLDVIAENIRLKKAKIGDILEISNAGSYAYSLSPLLFSSHEIPKQYFLDVEGIIREI